MNMLDSPDNLYVSLQPGYMHEVKFFYAEKKSFQHETIRLHTSKHGLRKKCRRQIKLVNKQHAAEQAGFCSSPIYTRKNNV